MIIECEIQKDIKDEKNKEFLQRCFVLLLGYIYYYHYYYLLIRVFHISVS